MRPFYSVMTALNTLESRQVAMFIAIGCFHRFQLYAKTHIDSHESYKTSVYGQ